MKKHKTCDKWIKFNIDLPLMDTYILIPLNLTLEFAVKTSNTGAFRKIYTQGLN